jgi:hypothetical protein
MSPGDSLLAVIAREASEWTEHPNGSGLMCRRGTWRHRSGDIQEWVAPAQEG